MYRYGTPAGRMGRKVQIPQPAETMGLFVVKFLVSFKIGLYYVNELLEQGFVFYARLYKTLRKLKDRKGSLPPAAHRPPADIFFARWHIPPDKSRE